MIYISQSTSYIYINLFERGESLSSVKNYTLTFQNEATKIETGTTVTASAITNRYFKFDINGVLTSSPDGFYTVTVNNGSTNIYTELVYLNATINVVYDFNDITTTYQVNEPS
jgi:hypothetical protein